MPNLIETMGQQYFNEKFQGAYFLNEGRIFRVSEALRTDRVRVNDIEASEQKVIPASVFNGFKAFEYPILGYRRFADHLYGYAYKRQTTHRGFRPDQVNITFTGCSRLLIDMGIIETILDSDTKAKALLKPQFDSIDQLPRLLNGELSGLVLNSNVMIEPSVETAEGWYSVLYKQARVGKMNARGRVTWTEPQFAEITGLN